MENLVDDLSLPDGFGANSGGNSFSYRKLKRADDQLIERILPAWGGLLDRNAFGVYRKLHYGWKGANPSDPTKSVHRPFLCVEERRGTMVTKECPACQLRSQYEKRRDAIKAEENDGAEKLRVKAKEKKATDAQLAAALAKNAEKFREELAAVNGWLKDHGVDKKFVMATINKREELGITSIPWGMAGKLKDEIKKIENRKYPASIAKGQDKNIKATDRWGVFFEFNRVGQAKPENDKVDVHMLQAEDGSMNIAFHRVSDELLKKAKTSMPDLVQMVEENRVSFEVVQKLVDHAIECGGSCDPATVDIIMGPRSKAPAPTKSLVDSKPESKEEPKAKSEVKPEPEDPFAEEAEKAPAKGGDAGTVLTTAAKPPTSASKPAEKAKEEPKAAEPTSVEGSKLADDQFEDIFA
jgi:hypothetical protein